MLYSPRLVLPLLLAIAAPVLAHAQPASMQPDPLPPTPRGFDNDQCNSPMPLQGSAVSFKFNTKAATTGVLGQQNQLCLLFGTPAIANDEWFLWTATGTGVATIECCGSTSVNTKIAVYEGPACLSEAIACDDNTCGLQSVVTFPCIAGQLYLIQAGKFPGSPDGLGTYTLTGPSPSPPNDDCSHAEPIGEGDFPFDTNGATTDGPPACGDIGADVWYRYTAPDDGVLTVSTCLPGSFDTVLAAYAGDCVATKLIACDDDACAPQSIISFEIVAGAEYLIRVGGASGATGGGVIVVTRGPPCREPCPPLSTPEGEPCGASINPGCDAPTPRFLILECNAVICGSAWAFQGQRDTDWYGFALNQPSRVQIALTGELPLNVRLYSFAGNCDDVQLIELAGTAPCGAPAIIDRMLAPGQYLVVVAPGDNTGPILDGFPCGSSNAYTLRVNFARPCPTEPAFFGGMLHTPLGVAQLSPGSVIIDNIGAAGTNGAVISVGPTAEGWRCDAMVPPGPLAPGAALVAAATGTVDGVPNMTLGMARIETIQMAQDLRLTPDFSPIRAATYSLRAFDGPTEVFFQPNRTGPAFERPNDGAVSRMIFACAPTPCDVPPCPQQGPFVPVFECRFPAPATFQIVGGPMLSATRFLITPENPEDPITSISEVGITADSVEPIRLDTESLVFRRLFHTARGDARFNASDDELGLDNMDAMNQDGVTIELDTRTGHYVAQLAPLGDPGDPMNPIPDGAFIDFVARGVVNGVPETVYSRSRYTDIGSRIRASFDFSFTGTDRLQTIYLLSGMPVGQELLFDNTPDFEADDWILTLEKTYDSCGRVVCQRPCWVPATGLSSPSGMEFTADVLEVIAINPTEDFDGYTSAEILFSDIPSVRIVTEVVEFAGECCACDFNGSGTLNSQDFFDFLTCFFGGACPPKRDADYNDDDVVNSQDFFDFLGCFFDPPEGCK